MQMQLRSDELKQLIKHQIKTFDSKIQMQEIGTVLSIGDGIVCIHGLEDCMMNELLAFENGVQCMALNLEQDLVRAVMLGPDTNIKEGDIVKRTGNVVSVLWANSRCSVVNALVSLWTERTHLYRNLSPIEKNAPGIIARKAFLNRFKQV